jgi:segregation and condensation protein A
VSDADDLSAYRVELPDFEGPLDLLLHLVKKHELSIVEIPIAFITDQYLKMIDLMQALNLEIVGEYLLMAATLAYLKSRELVPPDPEMESDEKLLGEDGEEELDPRQELIRRLLEYQKYKEAARALGERPVTGRNVWARGARAEEVAGLRVLPGGAPLAEVPVFRLIESLERVLRRAKVSFSHDVVLERVSISERIGELIDRLAREGTFSFESCFLFEEEAPLLQVRTHVVVTFLAILEMTRLRLVRLTQTDAGGAIYISQAVADLRSASSRLSETQEDEYK